MDKNKLYDALNDIPDDMTEDCRHYIERKKTMSNSKIMWKKVGLSAACFALAFCTVLGIYFANRTPKIDYGCVTESTENFSKLFFEIKSNDDTSTQQGIWANPIMPGRFRTSITLGQEISNASESKRFALKVDYIVKSEGDTEISDLKTVYEFFKSHGFEVGIIADELYMTATASEIVGFCDEFDLSDINIGAEFRLANPTSAQAAYENSIKY